MMTLEIFQAARPNLWGYAMRLTRKRYLAEDLIQETFLRAWRFRDQFKGDNPTGWLARIMRNVHLGPSVRRRSVETLNVDDLPNMIKVSESEGTLAVAGENQGFNEILAEQAAQCLTPAERYILYRIGVEQESYEAVAGETGLSELALRSRVHRARAKLAEVA